MRVALTWRLLFPVFRFRAIPTSTSAIRPVPAPSLFYYCSSLRFYVYYSAAFSLRLLFRVFFSFCQSDSYIYECNSACTCSFDCFIIILMIHGCMFIVTTPLPWRLRFPFYLSRAIPTSTNATLPVPAPSTARTASCSAASISVSRWERAFVHMYTKYYRSYQQFTYKIHD